MADDGFDVDPARDEVVDAFLTADPSGQRLSEVFRYTLDQLYDGQHTGRFRWDQLYKTEKMWLQLPAADRRALE